MCYVFAGQEPDRYAQINRSVRIGGHSTSIRLEAAFWDLIDEIALKQGLSTPKFLSLLHDEALEIHGEVSNFASMLRTTCLLYMRGARETAPVKPVTGRHARIATGTRQEPHSFVRVD